MAQPANGGDAAAVGGNGTPGNVTPQSPPSPSPSSSFTHRSSPSHIRLHVTHHDSRDDDGDEGSDHDDDDGGIGNGLPTYRDDLRHLAGEEDEDDQDSDALSESDSLIRRRRITVAKDDDESDTDTDEEHEDHDHDAHIRRRNARRQPDSYLHTIRPSAQRRRSWWHSLTASKVSGSSLSIPHVTLNLFAASLHPAVLLSTPFYFQRTGIPAGVAGLVFVAVLGGVGGGLWVVLSRYVGGSTLEAITAASFGGRTSPRRASLGRFLAAALLAVYSSGSALVAHLALVDVLLQAMYPWLAGKIGQDGRVIITFILAALVTAPLVLLPLAKRTMIRAATSTALLVYPAVLAILFTRVFSSTPPGTPSPSSQTPPAPLAPSLRQTAIWAPLSLLPLLTLSSSPLQILLHNRSLRRKPSPRAAGASSGSNVKAFFVCQAAQVALVVGMAVGVGVGLGKRGIEERLGREVRPNVFSSLLAGDGEEDDAWVNVARVLYVALLSTHFALCLTMGRASWARAMRVVGLNPFRGAAAQRRGEGQIRLEEGDGGGGGGDQPTASAPPRTSSSKKRWTKLRRTFLGNLLLYLLVSTLSYLSGTGGVRRRKHQHDDAAEALRFIRASEVLGLVGGSVGFVLPGLVWLLLFWVRRQRGILTEPVRRGGPGEGGGEGQPLADPPRSWISKWVKAPLGVLARRGGAAPASSATPPSASTGASTSIPTWHQETAPLTADANTSEATRILLARKERQLQKRTKWRRKWQDVLVCAAVLPFGVALVVLGASELSRGGY